MKIFKAPGKSRWLTAVRQRILFFAAVNDCPFLTANATVLFWFLVWAILPGIYDQTDETLYWKQPRIRGVASTKAAGIWASTKTLDKNNMKY